MESLNNLFSHLNKGPNRQESVAFLLALIRVAADALAKENNGYGEDINPLKLMMGGTSALRDLGVTEAEMASATLHVLGGNLPDSEKAKLQYISETGRMPR